MKTAIEKFIHVYEEETDALTKIIVKKGVGDFSWVKHLPVPLQNFETVYIHPLQENLEEGYIRIVHSEHKCVSVFNKLYFDFNLEITS